MEYGAPCVISIIRMTCHEFLMLCAGPWDFRGNVLER